MTVIDRVIRNLSLGILGKMSVRRDIIVCIKRREDQGLECLTFNIEYGTLKSMLIFSIQLSSITLSGRAIALRAWRCRFARNIAVVASGTAAAQVTAMALAPLITRIYGPGLLTETRMSLIDIFL